MDEYQPVRIAPAENKHACPDGESHCTGLWEAAVGRVVLVRPYTGKVSSVVMCRGRFFEFHPDEWPRLGIERKNSICCEHQILAD